MSQSNSTAPALTRDEKLKLIFRHTHRDFKGHAGAIWGAEHEGKRTIMVNDKGGVALVLLEDLTDDQIADKLPYALHREAKRKHEAAAKKAANAAQIVAASAQEVAR